MIEAGIAAAAFVEEGRRNYIVKAFAASAAA